MNKLKCYITKRYNGLYLVTAVKPKIVEVAGTGHKDAYIRYGDPIGYINISPRFAGSVFKGIEQISYTPVRAQIFGELINGYYNVIYNPKTNLYSIVIREFGRSGIDHVCPWFIEQMFDITKDDGIINHVHFYGELL